MDLNYRLTEEGDLTECLRLLECSTACPPIKAAEVRRRLPEVWRDLLTHGALNSAVLEDWDRPPGSRIVQFGASVFVTDAFAREARADPPAHLGARVLARLGTDTSPVLSPAAVRRANAGAGLTVVVLHYAHDTAGRSVSDAQQIFAKAPETFFLAHQGYRLQEVLIQLADTPFRDACLGAGFLIRDGAAGLLGISRGEAWEQFGTHVSTLFHHVPPRLGFRPSEQALLRRALRGETDEELAVSLAISPWTVKKRWREIYEQVATAHPGVLPPAAEQTRGAERRRHLLHYLRHHPEELRPL